MRLDANLDEIRAHALGWALGAESLEDLSFWLMTARLGAQPGGSLSSAAEQLAIGLTAAIDDYTAGHHDDSALRTLVVLHAADLRPIGRYRLDAIETDDGPSHQWPRMGAVMKVWAIAIGDHFNDVIWVQAETVVDALRLAVPRLSQLAAQEIRIRELGTVDGHYITPARRS